MTTGINFYPTTHFGSHKPFINWFKTSHVDWGDNVNASKRYEDTDGWLRAIPATPANGILRLFLQVRDISGNTNYTYIRSAPAAGSMRYKLAWNGNATATIFGTAQTVFSEYFHHAGHPTPGGTATPPSGYDNVYEVTVESNNAGFQVRVDNEGAPDVDFAPAAPSGGGTIVSPAFYHSDDEADLLAGEIFQSDFVKSYAGISIVRFMQANEANILGFETTGALSFAGQVEFVSLPAEDDRSAYYKNGVADDALGYSTGMCPALLAKFCNKVNAHAWVCIPPRFSKACIAAYAADIAANLATHLNVYIEPSNELWNAAWPYSASSAWCQRWWGQDISIVDGVGAAISSKTATISGNQLDFGEDVSSYFVNGGEINFLWTATNNGRPVTTNLAFTNDANNGYRGHCWVNVDGSDNTLVWLYKTAALAAADAARDGTGAMTLDGAAQTYTVYGGASTVRGDLVSCAGAELLCEAHAAFVAELGASRVKMVAAGWANGISGNDAMLKYVDPRDSVALEDKADYWSIAPYIYLATGGGVTNVSEAWMEANLSSLTPDWFYEAARNAVDETSNGLTKRVNNHLTFLVGKNPQLNFYEGGWQYASSTQNENVAIKAKAFLNSTQGKDAYRYYFDRVISLGSDFMQFADLTNWNATQESAISQHPFILPARHRFLQGTALSARRYVDAKRLGYAP